MKYKRVNAATCGTCRELLSQVPVPVHFSFGPDDYERGEVLKLRRENAELTRDITNAHDWKKKVLKFMLE